MAMDEDDGLAVAHPDMGAVWLFNHRGEPLYRVQSCKSDVVTNVRLSGEYSLHHRLGSGLRVESQGAALRSLVVLPPVKRLLPFMLLLWASAAAAFPSKPVKIIVAFPPGGGTDIVARLVGARLAEVWGQEVVVENRAGASGTIGTEVAARADADGHTLFMATMGNMTANQHLYPKMPVDPLRAFAPVTKVVDVHFVLLANPGAAGEQREGADRAGEEAARADPVQLVGPGRRAAPGDGAVQAPGGHRPRAHPVQGQRRRASTICSAGASC